MLKTASSIIIVYFSIIIIVAVLVPKQYVPYIFICVIITSFLLYYLRVEQTNVNISTNQTALLQVRIQKIIDSGYVKNNENIPLRQIRKFKYIFLEDDLVDMLVHLLKYEDSYKDVVYSVIYYSEAFMRQVFRMLDGKVGDEKLARNLGENIINQLYSLSYGASKYEKENMIVLQGRFTDFIWTMFEVGINAICKDFDPESPSPFDTLHSNNYDLYVF